MYIEPVSGMSLKSWSLADIVPPLSPYGEEGRGCYYLNYVRGIEDKDKTYNFWIEIEVGPRVKCSCAFKIYDVTLMQNYYFYIIVQMQQLSIKHTIGVEFSVTHNKGRGFAVAYNEAMC